MNVDQVLTAHRASGREFAAAGVRSFVLDHGRRSAEPVVCLHGVPASSFVYRKVLTELARRDLRGVSFDLPGLGLAERPANFDYSWTGLGRWVCAALDELELDRVHLIVHDLGGPVGFEVAAQLPDRVRSLLLLNTMVAVDTFHRPWVMEPFAHHLFGELWLSAARIPPVFRGLMRAIGVGPAVAKADLDAHLRLLLGDDQGRAFLRIMRSFELTAEKARRYEAVVASDSFPVDVLWGSRDPALPLRSYGVQARLAAGLATLPRVPGKHFLQEDFPAEIAAAAANLAERARS
jgi:haloalkane dehalogenase